MINSIMNSITKKIVRDYIYFRETLDDVKSISSDAEGEFRDAMHDHNEVALTALTPPEGAPPIKKIDEEPVVKFEDKLFKKLFRKIAVLCHPDKLDDSYSERESAFLKKCYEDLNTSNQTYDWGLLLKVAMELDVEIPELSDEQFININNNIESIKNTISQFEGSMAYKWYTLSDTDAKKGYLESCASIFMNSLNNR